MSYDHLLVSTSASGVRTITLNRPERLNAVNPRLADELPVAIDDAARDDTVRVVVVTGAGRGFCAGLDISEPPKLPDENLRARPPGAAGEPCSPGRGAAGPRRLSCTHLSGR